jgi:hypothetical protein
MKYLVQNTIKSRKVIYLDFENELTSKWQISSRLALKVDKVSMGMYWSTARACTSQEQLEEHLSRYYTIVERLSNIVEPNVYEYW